MVISVDPPPYTIPVSGKSVKKAPFTLSKGANGKLWHQHKFSGGHGYDLSRITKANQKRPKDRPYWIERGMERCRKRPHQYAFIRIPIWSFAIPSHYLFPISFQLRSTFLYYPTLDTLPPLLPLRHPGSFRVCITDPIPHICNQARHA